MSILINVLLVIHVLVSLLIVLLVLMQRPKNEGLGAAFGGGMTENLFGAQTTNVLQTFTRYLGGMFFILTLLLSWLYVKQTAQNSSIQQRLLKQSSVPAVLSTPAPDDKVPGKPAADDKPAAPETPTGPAKPLEPASVENQPGSATKPAPMPAAPVPAPVSPTPASATPRPATPAPSPATPAP